MTDYISREAAIKAIVNLTTYHTAPEINTYVEAAYYREREWIGGIRDALIEIGDLPAADVRPVVRGEWKTAWLDHEAFGERPRVFYCSACNQVATIRTPICPHCGADMTKEVPGHE